MDKSCFSSLSFFLVDAFLSVKNKLFAELCEFIIVFPLSIYVIFLRCHYKHTVHGNNIIVEKHTVTHD